MTVATAGSRRTRAPRVRAIALVLGLTAAGIAALAPGGSAVAAPVPAAPVYRVLQEGLTLPQAVRLAQTYGIPNALQDNGAFNYTDSRRFGEVPLTHAGPGVGLDEGGRAVTRQALDLAALERLRPYDEAAALAKAARLLEDVSPNAELRGTPVVSHAELTLADRDGNPRSTRPIDTSVTYRFSLGGLPAEGQGGKVRITFAADGTVTQLTHALRTLQRERVVPVIGAVEAQRACAALYGPGVRQLPPTLGYPLPELAARDGSGRGRMSHLLPQYTCRPVGEAGPQAHRVVPAVAGSGPEAKVRVSVRAGQVEAAAAVSGGTGPYTYGWSSSTTVLTERAAERISYQRKPRDRQPVERVTLQLTDANGLTATASLELTGDGAADGGSVPGGGGFAALAVGPVDVGVENTVDEWQCAQDSAQGFRDAMAARGVPAAFDWRGTNAWERDFKDQSRGGWDKGYVDNVDAQWYTGHGGPGGFTFAGSVDDTTIVPSDARWGDGDLEWLQLESCQVLADVTGTHDYFRRWDEAFAGLHILNGFHTNAYCVGGGTGGTFAEYLFPKKFGWWPVRPALPVRNAWARTAIDKEPTGVVYRSMGPIGAGGVTDIGDHFWGQGLTGPDITPTGGFWAVSGTV